MSAVALTAVPADRGPPPATRSSFRQPGSSRRLTLVLPSSDASPAETVAGGAAVGSGAFGARRRRSVLSTPCPSLTSHRALTAAERRRCEERFKEVPSGVNSLPQLRALLYRCGQQLDVADLVLHLDSIGFRFSMEVQYMNLDTFLELMAALKAQYVAQLEDPDLDMLDAFTAMGGHRSPGGRVSSVSIASAIQGCGLPVDAVPEAFLGDIARTATSASDGMDFITFKHSLMAGDEVEEEWLTARGSSAAEAEGEPSDDGEDDHDRVPAAGALESPAASGLLRRGSIAFSLGRPHTETEGARRPGPTPAGDGFTEPSPHRRTRSKAEVRLRAILQGHEDRLGGQHAARRPAFPKQRMQIVPLTRPRSAGEQPWRPTKPRAPGCLRRFEEEQQRLQAAVLDGPAGSAPSPAPGGPTVHRKPQRRPHSASPGFGRPLSASRATSRWASLSLADSPASLAGARLPFLLRHATPAPQPCAEPDPGDVDWFLLPPNLPPRAGGRYLLQDPRRAGAEVFVHEGRIIQATPYAYIDLGPAPLGGEWLPDLYGAPGTPSP